MARVCRTAKEFAEAVTDNEEYITIEGDLKNGVLRIKATGKIAWGVYTTDEGINAMSYTLLDSTYFDYSISGNTLTVFLLDSSRVYTKVGN